jgi:hypothetical protein
MNEILSNPFTSITFTSILKIPKIQMEHSHLIVEPNVTHKRKRKNFDWAIYGNNIFELLKVCSNLTYYAKKKSIINY